MQTSQDNAQKVMESGLVISLVVLVVILTVSLNVPQIEQLFQYANSVVEEIVNP